MDELITSLAPLLAPLRPCFRHEAFLTFQQVLVAWLLCPGPRTLTEVWQVCALRGRRHYTAIYHLFGAACWDWDEIGALLLLRLLTLLLPEGYVWLVVDDTLCHKRGAKVAFGGIFLDAVLSTKRHKTLRFGVNWVVLGIAVPIPWRPDRYYCLPVLWRAYRKKDQAGYQSRPHAAAAMARLLAEANPERTFWLVGDSAYVNAATLQGRPKNLQVIGPLHWKAALYQRPAPPVEGQKGRPRKKGERLPTPKAMIEDVASYPAEIRTVAFPQVTRELRLQLIRDVLWYRGCKTDPVAVLLVRDPLGQWRDEALIATDPGASAEFILQGYCRRWSVELAFFDSKQYLGLHDPRVWSERSVERAHPMAWFVGTLTILWYAISGHAGAHVHRDRDWYRHKVTPTFTDMLGALRLQMWQHEVFGPSGTEAPSPEVIETLLHKMAAVA